MEQKFYGLNDLVRADCHDCAGCSSCCRDMGESILLDPYDVYQMQKGAGLTAEALFAERIIALTVWKGLILPCLQMDSERGACGFLRENRCSIHSFRPGICRLFPLGRNFEEGRMNYFLLEDACANRGRSKIRVSKWLGIQPAAAYHDFVLAWHDFRYGLLAELADGAEEQAKTINMELLRRFYLTPYDTREDFYPQFYGRCHRLSGAM